MPILATGETATTVSGRATAPFPKVDLATERRSTNTLKRVDAWLHAEARAELVATGSDRRHLIQCGVEGSDPANLTPAERDGFHLIVFGTTRDRATPGSCTA